MTNGQKIRGMTDEEMAKWLCVRMDCYNCDAGPGGCEDYCRNVLLDWLKQEVKADDER